MHWMRISFKVCGEPGDVMPSVMRNAQFFALKVTGHFPSALISKAHPAKCGRVYLA
jgi:hypothetical protein